jgi:peroxiredoxin
MSRRFLALCVTALLASAPCVRGQTAAPPDPVAALANELDTGRAEYHRRYERAETDDARQQLEDAERERVRGLARRALDLAARHADAPLALDARTWVVNGGLGSYPETTEAFQLLADKHLADPRLGPAVEIAVVYSQIPAAEQLLLAAWEKSPHRDVRGKAGFALAWRAERQGQRLTKDRPGAGAAKTAEAERLLEAVARDYADVPGHRGTLGIEANALLFSMRHLVVGKPAPDFRCTDAADRPVKLSDLAGRVVVLDFWYVGCGPCRGQFPHLRKLTERLAGRPFTLVGVSADEDRGEWEAFLKKERLPWEQWYSGRGGVVTEWSVASFPTVYVIDGKGLIRFKNVHGEPLDKAVDALLAELTATPKKIP